MLDTYLFKRWCITTRTSISADLEHTVRKLNQAVDGPDHDIEQDVAADPGNDHGACAGNAITERVGVTTGDIMIDKFETFYAGTVFACVFSYTCGFPDTPALHVIHDLEDQQMRLG